MLISWRRCSKQVSFNEQEVEWAKKHNEKADSDSNLLVDRAKKGERQALSSEGKGSAVRSEEVAQNSDPSCPPMFLLGCKDTI